MCQNIKKYRNPYTFQYGWTKCGKCQACKQEKANRRANRIRYNNSSDYVTLFVHLTYADAYVPYIYKEDLQIVNGEYADVPVYRKHDVRWYFNVKSHVSACYSTLNDIKQISLHKYSVCSLDDIDALFDVGDGRFTVLYYKDVQNFFKRLRQNLKRNERFKSLVHGSERISYFVCGEYGCHKTDHQRCHWHIILYVPKFNVEDTEVFNLWKDAICGSWLYAFDFVTRNSIEVAIDAASYASEYVNCSSDVSNFLQAGSIRPTWHYSHHFGFGFSPFNLDNIIYNVVNRETFTFDTFHCVAPKCYIPVTLPVPKYVQNAYFPSFKSLCHLSYQKIFEIVSNPTAIYQNIQGLNGDDFRKIIIKLSNVYEKYFAPRSFSRYDYARLYVDVLRCSARSMWLQQYSLKSKRDSLQWYYNTKELYDSDNLDKFIVHFGFLNLSFNDYDYIKDVNDWSLVIKEHNSLVDMFNRRVKKRRISQLQRNV